MFAGAKWKKSEDKLWEHLWELKNKKGDMACVYRDGLIFDYEIYFLNNKNTDTVRGYFSHRKCKSFEEAIVLINKIIIKEIDKRIKDLNDFKKVLTKK